MPKTLLHSISMKGSLCASVVNFINNLQRIKNLEEDDSFYVGQYFNKAHREVQSSPQPQPQLYFA
jgi:hypothetical protein